LVLTRAFMVCDMPEEAAVYKKPYSSKQEMVPIYRHARKAKESDAGSHQ
jgi:hypothetical protein